MNPDLKFDNEPVSRYIPFDEAAFEKFFIQHFCSLCYYCQVKFGFDIDLAKETVHTGFIKLWETRQSLSGDLSVKAYLYKIISNNCLDVLRHNKVKQKYTKYVLELNAESFVPDHSNNPDFKCLAADINKAISELPEQMRKVFELSRYEGLKYAEISAQLHISVKTVETQMSRALIKLRVKLSAYLPLHCLMFLFNF